MIARAALAAAAVALLASPAAARRDRHPDAGKDVAYYLSAPEERWTKLFHCRNDEAEARHPTCANARAAEEETARAERFRGRHRVRTPNQWLTDPGYYRDNPVARAAALAQCNSPRWGAAMRPADCAAARAAQGAAALRAGR